MPASDALIRLRLLGRAAFVKDARAAERALGRVGRSTPASKSYGSGISSRLRTIRGEAGRTQTALRKVGQGAGSSLGGLGGTAAAAGAAAGVGILGTQAIKAGVGFNKMQDAQRVAFTTLLGSAPKAAAYMKQIQQLALDSPILDPASTGDSARLLMAFGVQVKDTLPFVKALGDMSAATGKDIGEVMPRGAMAVGQIASKGKLQAEEMNQLAESVGLSRKAIRTQLGLSQKDFEKTFRPGKNIKADVALPAIMNAMRAQSGGAAQMLSQTTQGKFARAREVGARAAGSFTRPIYDRAGNAAGRVADSLQKTDLSGAGKTVGKGIDAAASGAGKAIGFLSKNVVPQLVTAGKQVITALKPAVPFLQNVLLPLLIGVGKGILGGVVGAFRVVVPVMGFFARVLGSVGQKAKPFRGAIEGIGTAIGFLFGGPILKALGFIPKLGVVFRIAAIPVRLLAGAVRGVGRAIGAVSRLFGRGVSFIQEWLRFVVSIPNRAAGIVPRVIRSASRIALGFVNRLQSIVRGARRIPGRIAGALKNSGSSILNAGRWVGGKVISGLVAAIKAASGAVANAVINVIPGPVRSAVSGAIGLGGSAVSSVAHAGSLLDKIRGRASGGVTRHGELTRVNERGREQIRLPGGSRVYTAGATRRMERPRMVQRSTRPIVIEAHYTAQLERRTLHRGVVREERHIAEFT